MVTRGIPVIFAAIIHNGNTPNSVAIENNEEGEV